MTLHERRKKQRGSGGISKIQMEIESKQRKSNIFESQPLTLGSETNISTRLRLRDKPWTKLAKRTSRKKNHTVPQGCLGLSENLLTQSQMKRSSSMWHPMFESYAT